MNSFNQKGFNTFAVDNDCLIFEEVELSSGRVSNFYDQWRKITGDVALLEKIALDVLRKTSDMVLEVNCFYGVPDSATSLGFMTQYLHAERQGMDAGKYVLPMGRKFPKTYGYGEENFVVKPQGKTLVLENVITTGGSVFQELNKLENAGVEVVGVITLTDRMQVNEKGVSVKKMFENKGITYGCLSDALTLLPRLYNKLNPGEEVGRKLEEEYKQYGVKEIRVK
jgi:orotate phosphoribosyltransferase